MFRTNVNEVNVETVDLGNEIRQGVQSGLDLAPVVLFLPIAREFLQGRELGAFRLIRDRFTVGPPCRVDALAQFGEFRFWKSHAKRTNGGLVSRLFRNTQM